MQHISEDSLNDLRSRIQYLHRVIGFTASDAATLHAAKDVVAPLVPVVVDAVYQKLLSFDITAKSFVPRPSGYTEETPTKLSELSLEHPHLKLRRNFLTQYMVKLVTMDYSKMESWEYLDKIGLMHTGKAGFAHRVGKPPLRVEYIHLSLILGYVEDMLINAVITHPDLDIATKSAVVRAANKIIWIQSDLIARHYITPEPSSPSAISFNTTVVSV
jgi:hypothetical protein